MDGLLGESVGEALRREARDVTLGQDLISGQEVQMGSEPQPEASSGAPEP